MGGGAWRGETRDTYSYREGRGGEGGEKEGIVKTTLTRRVQSGLFVDYVLTLFHFQCNYYYIYILCTFVLLSYEILCVVESTSCSL